MEGLTKEARLLVERNIDSIIKDPKSYEEWFSDILREMGIELNLETMVSFSSGFVVGMIQEFYYKTLNRSVNHEETTELYEIMKRRAFEIRMALMTTRIEE